jgi:hypothetical protein
MSLIFGWVFGIATKKSSADADDGSKIGLKFGRHQHIPSPRRSGWTGLGLWFLLEAGCQFVWVLGQ